MVIRRRSSSHDWPEMKTTVADFRRKERTKETGEHRVERLTSENGTLQLESSQQAVIHGPSHAYLKGAQLSNKKKDPFLAIASYPSDWRCPRYRTRMYTVRAHAPDGTVVTPRFKRLLGGKKPLIRLRMEALRHRIPSRARWPGSRLSWPIFLEATCTNKLVLFCRSESPSYSRDTCCRNHSSSSALLEVAISRFLLSTTTQQIRGRFSSSGDITETAS